MQGALYRHRRHSELHDGEWHGFKAIIENAQLGVYPDGIDPELAAPVVAALIVSFQPAGEISASAHFDSVATANGLARFVEADL